MSRQKGDGMMDIKKKKKKWNETKHDQNRLAEK